jgi:signal transduction histidine kinase
MVLVIVLFLMSTLQDAGSTFENDLQTDSLLVLTFSSEEQNLIGSDSTWRFSPGDDMRWAAPDFDHSDWILHPPSGMFKPLPDSLWPGYGWFRLHFLADSSFYANPWFFYFYTWGAAEIYIDGALAKTYGVFSTNPDEEVKYSPSNKLHQPFVLAPRDTHTIAVRFSYHDAHRYKRIMGDFSANFGFGIGFANSSFNDNLLNSKGISTAVSYTSASVLLLITLLHGFLFYLFPQQRANLLIAIITFLLFLHNISAFHHLYFETGRMMNFILNQYSFLLLYMAAITLIPYTIAQLFNQISLDRLKYLPLVIIPLFVLFYFWLAAFLFIIIFIGILILTSSSYALYKAFKANEKGVAFVATGFMGLILMTFVIIGYGELASDHSWAVEAVGITLIYVSVPVSMSLFTAKRLADLYISLEDMVREQTSELRQSLQNLESAQKQMVQQEKLASLGQLTAGIAHEIKNPLNFVNNFSSVSIELVDEAIEESKSIEQRTVADEIEAILGDIRLNLTKINDHGTRADRIVKSMLMHSRGGSGNLEPTALNPLIQEYANLSYHGMRASKNSFNAEVDLNLDDTITEIPLIAEDFSRVLLNLCNNAFDAMREKSKDLPTDKSYKPRLRVESKQTDKEVIININDNGSGVAADIKDKVLQPFFTTKKGTQGTGLGLSITNDIVLAHGGRIEIESEPGEGTTFKIYLPNGK